MCGQGLCIPLSPYVAARSQTHILAQVAPQLFTQTSLLNEETEPYTLQQLSELFGDLKVIQAVRKLGFGHFV
jgi:hypothetical protein